MQRQHNIADAKAHLTELLRCVERGEEVIITRRGKAIARLSPIQPIAALSSQADFRATLPCSERTALDHLCALRNEER